MLFSARWTSLIILMSVFCLCACDKSTGDPTGQLVEQRSTDGNVTTVRTISGSIWGGVAHLVEEISIGDPERGDAYLLALVQAIECDSERIYVLDQQIPIIHIYDMQGEHLYDIGREGQGPGEYLGPRSLALNPLDGNLYVRDDWGVRISIFTPQGEYVESWQLFGGWSFSRPMFFADDGRLYTPSYVNPNREGRNRRGSQISWGAEGALGDTLAEPEVNFEEWQLIAQISESITTVRYVPFSPRASWTYSRTREIIGGVSEGYHFEVHSPDGHLVVIERDCDPVQIVDEEADWHERAMIAEMRDIQSGWAWNGRSIPPHKPSFDHFTADRSGRIWVWRPGPGMRVEGGVKDPLSSHDLYWEQNPLWIDTWMVDVFTYEGEFLGEVDLPLGFQFYPEPYIKDDIVIAHFIDDQGMPYIKKYRLVLPDRVM